MLIFDAHCDTLEQMFETRSNLFSNSLHVDIKRLKQIPGKYIQTFAIYLNPNYQGLNAYNTCNNVLDLFYRELKQNSNDLMLCKDKDDFDYFEDSSYNLGAFLSIEGASCLNKDIYNLQHFYDRGVRMLSLTWNNINELGCGIIDSLDDRIPDELKGLTEFGKQVIKEMNRLGIVIDVSHLSEKSFFQAIEISKKPLIASHSNCMDVCQNPRNLTLEQLRCIKDIGGVVGVNLNPDFLNESGSANIYDIIYHIEYIVSHMGEDYIGLGTDFDGISQTPIDINGVQDIYNIFNCLLKLNYSEQFVHKFASRNFLRVIKDVII